MHLCNTKTLPANPPGSRTGILQKAVPCLMSVDTQGATRTHLLQGINSCHLLPQDPIIQLSRLEQYE